MKKCKIDKELKFYPKRKDSFDGHRNTCKTCTNNGMKIRYTKVENKIKEACHYANLQPLWAEKNWIKGRK